MKGVREYSLRVYRFEFLLTRYSISALEAACVAVPRVIPDTILSEVLFETWTRDRCNIQSNQRAITPQNSRVRER